MFKTVQLTGLFVTGLLAATVAWGQQGPPPGQPGPAPTPPQADAPSHRGPMHQNGGPSSRSRGGMQMGPGGKWWDNPEIAKRIGITADQQKKMDDVFQQSRLKLIDLSANLQKEEVIMEGLMSGPQLDDAKILPVADRIAQARADLEKANVRLLLGIRHVLTPEQWTKVESDGPQRPSPRGRNSGGPPPHPFDEEE